jgi:hypothetical protein
VIHGTFDPESPEWPVPTVRALVHLEGFSSAWTGVTFLLDTGATTTCLHPVDSLRIVPRDLLTDPGRWPHRDAIVGVGGPTFCFQHPGYIALFDEDTTEWFQFKLTYSIAQFGLASARLPSLLGWDVLTNFAVLCDWSSRSITLESRI